MRSCILAVSLVALLLSACAGTPSRPLADTTRADPPEAPGLDAGAFGEPLAVPPVESLFTLTTAQEADFLRYFHDPDHAAAAPHWRVFDYLDQRLHGFRPYGSTRIAADALAANEGNCLSLALLTTALARLAGVEIAYKRVSDEPVFERHADVVFAADHVRSLLFDPGHESTPGESVWRKPHIVVDYFPERRRRAGGRVSELTLQSMFYTNLAGEAMVGKRYREAFWLLRAALEEDPANRGALNSLAVLHYQTGNETVAEAIFRHALTRFGDSANLLGNYRALLLRQGRDGEVAALERRLALLPIRNPFDLVELGNHAFFQERYQDALGFYQQAQARAPYLHEVYWRQAIVHQSMGNPHKAEQLLMTAATTAPRADDQRLYRAKALSLRAPGQQ